MWSTVELATPSQAKNRVGHCSQGHLSCTEAPTGRSGWVRLQPALTTGLADLGPFRGLVSQKVPWFPKECTFYWASQALPSLRLERHFGGAWCWLGVSYSKKRSSLEPGVPGLYPLFPAQAFQPQTQKRPATPYRAVLWPGAVGV